MSILVKIIEDLYKNGIESQFKKR